MSLSAAKFKAESQDATAPHNNENFIPLNPHSSIKKVIGIASGKGGVGKSLVASCMAIMARRKGFNVGILDADISGPTIPYSFGVSQKARADERGVYPELTYSGIRIMSVNLLLDDAESPVMWDGAVVSTIVQQFWSAVYWGNLDVLFIDMPPGTGDIPQTIYDSIPLDGVIFVSTPQEMIQKIVMKAVNMARVCHVPVLGIVENMAYTVCPDCGHSHSVFGKGKLMELCDILRVPLLAQIPFDPNTSRYCDDGVIERIENASFFHATSQVLKKIGLDAKI